MFIFCAYIFVGLVLIAAGIPLAMRKVRPNPYYGFRTKATLGDEKLWYAVNAATGRVLVIGGIVGNLATVILYFRPGISEALFSAGALVILSLVMIAILLASFILLRRIKRRLGLK